METENLIPLGTNSTKLTVTNSFDVKTLGKDSVKETTPEWISSSRDAIPDSEFSTNDGGVEKNVSFGVAVNLSWTCLNSEVLELVKISRSAVTYFEPTGKTHGTSNTSPAFV